MSKLEKSLDPIARRYKDVNNEIDFGNNSFAMLKYAHENPGCFLESFDPKEESSMSQKFIKVHKSQSRSYLDYYKITAIVEREGEQMHPIDMNINKQDWNEATW